MYWYILYIGKPQNERKNCEKKIGKPKYLHRKFFLYLKKNLKNITAV